MSAEDYMRERAAVLATAVGIARLHLRRHRPVEALAALDVACEETDDLLRRYLLSVGASDEAINLLLGTKP